MRAAVATNITLRPTISARDPAEDRERHSQQTPDGMGRGRE
jgi:hypothetical protein